MKSILVLAAVVSVSAVPQQPREAGVQPTTGTASISGVIVTDEPQGRPVRRAIVTLTGAGLRPSRGAITDDEGRFRIERLPEGRFTLTAARAAFVTSVYGAKRPGRPGTPIILTDGEAVADITVRLWRGAVVGGVVRDEHGAPIDGLEVHAVQARTSARGRILTLSNNGVSTNDRGEYRIFGLEPGTYVIAARPSSSFASPKMELAESQIDAALARLRMRSAQVARAASPPVEPFDAEPFVHAPVYYPGTPVLGRATPLRLEAGQEALGLDFSLQRVRAVAVEGRLLRTDGGSAANAAVQLTEVRLSDQFTTEPLRVIRTTSQEDGSFRFTQVTPGYYELLVRAPIGELQRTGSNPNGQIRPGFVDATLWAMTEVDVVGTDLTNLVLTLERPLVMFGRVVFEGDSIERPADLGQLQIGLFSPDVLRQPGSSVQSIGPARPTSVRPDGTFTLDNVVPGTYRFTVGGPPVRDAGWWPRGAMLDGRDLLDGRIEIKPGMNLADIIVTLTDRRSELSGALQTPAGGPASDVFVIAYSADPGHWGPDARRVQAVRPDVDGRYTIKDLPAGDYLIAAVTDVDESEWEDPAFLEQLAFASVPISIADGEHKIFDLRIGRQEPTPDHAERLNRKRLPAGDTSNWSLLKGPGTAKSRVGVPASKTSPFPP